MSPSTVVLIGIVAMLITTLLWIGFGFVPDIRRRFHIAGYALSGRPRALRGRVLRARARGA